MTEGGPTASGAPRAQYSPHGEDSSHRSAALEISMAPRNARGRWFPSINEAQISRATRITFWVACAAFLIWYGWLGTVNNEPGGWDSAANLIAARNIAEGRGFVTDIVGDYVIRHELPGPEFTRPPGLPYVIASIYRITGPSLSVHVWLNTLVILLAAVILRAAIRVDGGDWPADVAGLAMLHVHAPVTNALNNGPLILVTATMLLLVVLSIRTRLTGIPLALACAVVTAAGFMMKQTFMVSGAACAVLLLGWAPERAWRQRARDCVAFVVVFLLLTAPYWAVNLAKYGEPLYAPVHQFHLQHHYSASPWYDFYRRVLWDETPMTLREVTSRVGILHMMRIELNFMRERIAAIGNPNPFLLIPAALGILLLRRSQWRVYAAVGTLTLAPLAETAMWFPEPRYLLPLFPCIFFLGWLAVRNYRQWARANMRPAVIARVRAGYAAVLVGAGVFAVVTGWPALHKEMIMARTPTPSWRAIVSSLPTNSVVMSDQPPWVSWWTRRYAIAAPVDERADLLTVLREYQPTYYMDFGTHAALQSWKPDELNAVASGAGWTLHRIRVPGPDSPRPGNTQVMQE